MSGQNKTMNSDQTGPDAPATSRFSRPPPRRATGPRTKKGKARSSRNALQDGFLSKEVVICTHLWSEDKSEFKRLFDNYVAHFRPQGQPEIDQLEIAVCAFWRYRRFLKAETGAILVHRELLWDESLEGCPVKGERPPDWEKRDLDEIIDEVVTKAAAQDWKKELRERQASIPSAYDIDRLQRYEARLLRVYYRALNELERLQRMRLGDRVPAPLVVDIQN